MVNHRLFQRCFIFQQSRFDVIKEGRNSIDPVKVQEAQVLKDFVIDWYKGDDMLTPIAQAYSDLVTSTPPTNDRLNEPAVKACSERYFPDWYVAPANPNVHNWVADSDEDAI